MPTIVDNLSKLNQQITLSLAETGRAETSCKLLCVSKTRTENEIQQAIDAGQRLFAENQVQEALPKIAYFQDYDLEWHFIGRLQNNKTAKVAEHFSWAQSVCQLKTAQRLNEQRPKQLPPLNICLQVNVDDDPNKAGIAPDDILTLGRCRCQTTMFTLAGLNDRIKKRKQYQATTAKFC